MRGVPFLRLALTLLLAAGLVLGGFGTAPAKPSPTTAMAGCLHHAAMAGDRQAAHGKAEHDQGAKADSCQCPLMTCSGWTLVPVAASSVDVAPAAVPRQFGAASAFLPHQPAVPLEPPRALT